VKSPAPSRVGAESSAGGDVPWRPFPWPSESLRVVSLSCTLPFPVAGVLQEASFSALDLFVIRASSCLLRRTHRYAPASFVCLVQAEKWTLLSTNGSVHVVVRFLYSSRRFSMHFASSQSRPGNSSSRDGRRARHARHRGAHALLSRPAEVERGWPRLRASGWSRSRHLCAPRRRDLAPEQLPTRSCPARWPSQRRDTPPSTW